MSENESKDLEWNIGSHRIEYLGKKTTQVRESFDKAVKHPTEGRIENYFHNLETLFFDIRQYIESEEKKEEFDKAFQELNKKDSLSEELSKVKELDKKIQEKRLDLGLDIPSKTSADSILD
jgi:hypothetical protein